MYIVLHKHTNLVKALISDEFVKDFSKQFPNEFIIKIDEALTKKGKIDFIYDKTEMSVNTTFFYKNETSHEHYMLFEKHLDYSNKSLYNLIMSDFCESYEFKYN